MEQNQQTAQQVIAELTGRMIDTVALWADVSQHAQRDWMEVSTCAAKEGAKLYAEFQRTALDALRESPGAFLGWRTAWLEGPRDPIALYQKFLSDSVAGAQKAVHLAEENAQAVTRAAERVHESAQEAGKGIQEIYKDAVTKTREIYARN
ncbi:MAG: hypothetical protein HY294_03465 [Candidatus Rokubacteria bacterium]|nr:hypothetical protein [Candidatus Rokubacteria bacterium]MBI3825033.1 hypothetical protein [Candidatus Rokubacteria bacterium]